MERFNLKLKNVEFIEMRITYDEEVDALYLRLKETPYHESDEIREGLILDYDESGNLVAVEILDASDYLSPAE